jgi:hypothetical protein
MDTLRQRLEALEDEVRTVRRRRWRQLAGGVLVLALVGLLHPWGLAAPAPEDDPDRTWWHLLNLWGRVSALERTLTHVRSVTGAGGQPEVVITGANLRLVNGQRATATTNGLGNLLVGYNEPREGGHVQTGSHNVVGQGHKVSSFGGLVVGRQNEIGGAFAAVSGGFGNTASGSAAAVSGGDGNTASGHTAALSGGEANTASGFCAAVSGGRHRTAHGDFSWVADPRITAEEAPGRARAGAPPSRGKGASFSQVIRQCRRARHRDRFPPQVPRHPRRRARLDLTTKDRAGQCQEPAPARPRSGPTSEMV